MAADKTTVGSLQQLGVATVFGCTFIEDPDGNFVGGGNTRNATYVDCLFKGDLSIGSGGGVSVTHRAYNTRSTGSITVGTLGSLLWYGGEIGTDGPGKTITVSGSGTINIASSITASLSISSSNVAGNTVDNMGTLGGSVSVSTTVGQVVVTGDWSDVTFSNAPTSPRRFTGSALSMDFTGPGKLDLQNEASNFGRHVTLRGSSIRADLGMHFGRIVALSMAHSLITANFEAGAGGWYTLDATTHNNVLILAGTNDPSFNAGAVSNLGALNRIITEDTDSLITGLVTSGALQGPPGDEGPPGADGADGPPGTGAPGPTGPTGLTGVAGPQGPPGDDGAPGADGETGQQGPTGVAGATGATGAQGPTGPPGDDGAPGEDGNVGPQGPIGATGATGATGPTGSQGAQGAPGPPGDDGAPGEDGNVGPQGPIGATGATGPQGATGSQGAQGAQGPPGEDGAQGDPGEPGQSPDGYNVGGKISDLTGLLPQASVSGWRGRPLSSSFNPPLSGYMPVYDGTSWQALQGGGASASYVPTVAQGATNNITKTINYAQYIQIGRIVIVWLSLAITGSGTSSNDVTVSVPITEATSASIQVGSGTMVVGTAKMKVVCQLVGGSSVFKFRRTDDATATTNVGNNPTTALASGDNILVFAIYEAAAW